MTSRGYMKDTQYSICIGEESFGLSYDDLVCLKYLLSNNGSGKRLQRPEYEELLSEDAKEFYRTILKRYKTIKQRDKEAYIKRAFGRRHRDTLLSKRLFQKHSNLWAKQFFRSQLHKIEDTLNQAEQERQIEGDLNILLDKLLPVE